MSFKLYKSSACGKIAMVLTEGEGSLSCCGEPMVEMKANSTDAATEKHVPVVTVEGNQVTAHVGSVTHPMSDEHLIQWICLETTNGVQLKKLNSSSQPTACFTVPEGEKPVAVYEYCNLHGLWVKEL